MNGPPPQGELTFVDNSVDTTTGTIQLKATFPNADDKLWPGQFVQVTLTLSELTNAVVVPIAGSAERPERPVHLRRETRSDGGRASGEDRHQLQGETVVESGLQAGETVVTDGQLRLAPGVKVNVKNFAVRRPQANSPTNAP